MSGADSGSNPTVNKAVHAVENHNADVNAALNVALGTQTMDPNSAECKAQREYDAKNYIAQMFSKNPGYEAACTVPDGTNVAPGSTPGQGGQSTQRGK